MGSWVLLNLWRFRGWSPNNLKKDANQRVKDFLHGLPGEPSVSEPFHGESPRRRMTFSKQKVSKTQPVKELV